MKKLFLVLLLTVPLFSDNFLNSFLPNTVGKSFISFGFVHQDIKEYENSQALNLQYSFIHQDYWGLDIGYVQSLSDSQSLKNDEKTDFSSATFFGTYTLPFTGQVALKGKVGYAKNKHSDDTIAYGTELTFQIAKNIGLSIAYHKMNEQMNYVLFNSVYKLRSSF